jgi:small multidrug resistance family-3 protein
LPTVASSKRSVPLRRGKRKSDADVFAYIGAPFPEIAGCFSFWAWLRLGKSPLWIVPGMVSLALFAGLLTLFDSDAADRAYAACGGIYIAASLIWLWTIEGLTRTVGTKPAR